ncbi:Cell division protein FtsI/penicillin-binding protein 2 [Georgenia satyanarayanai]|uniref:Beta-lactamase n=1 Tax=Georgenia satyanarayanai TaxID=860221 RepID=A0A2Y8ZWP9_9MICO|nr:penicillin-binding transpeptidase domain-containing protein [Georgenia satyanarayanai]PYG01947.1 cell division protein FtsI/penicillin-binding protein 2 [Georgenia satyanarayanai]SSA36750.1 Cell division protein FtsI/penicillin-binding protein 2 [Georgenia satyanarayanai]
MIRRLAPACALALLLTACSGPEDDGLDAAAAGLASALAEQNLDGVTLTDPAAAGSFGELVAPLAEYDVTVEAQEVVRAEDDGGASVDLAWSWTVEDHEWTYTTTAELTEQEEGGWALAWDPAVLAPGLTDGERLEVTRTLPERADVLGADDELIVTERPVGRYGLDKTLVEPEEVGERAEEVAEALGIDPAAFRERAEAMGPRAFVEAIVLRPEDAEDAVEDGFADIPGARVVEDAIPLAPTREFARELLGRVGPATAEVVEASEGRVRAGDEVGLSGLQAAFEEQLRGTPDIEVAAVDAADARRTLFEAEGTAPEDLRLTLDVDVQQAAEEILYSSEDTESSASAVVALRPSTGEVLAAANGPGNEGLNAATAGQYAPGSTFKVVTSLALLRAGLAPDDVVTCSQSLTVDGREFTNYDDYPASALGEVPFRTALAHSCNTALMDQRELLDDGDLAAAAEALGIGVERDLGFPAYLGLVPAPESETERAASLIGQGRVLASPLAMATVAASVQAGHAVLPQLVADAVPEAAGPAQPLTEEEAEQLRELMRAVVTEGSGVALDDVPGEPVLAKTGTAEYGSPDDDGAHETHAWMIAAQGDLAVAVLVETGVSGSQTAGPVLEELLTALAD